MGAHVCALQSIEDIDREVELLVLIQGQDNIIQLKVCAACSNLARMGFQAMQIGRFLKAFRLSFHVSRIQLVSRLYSQARRSRSRVRGQSI